MKFEIGIVLAFFLVVPQAEFDGAESVDITEVIVGYVSSATHWSFAYHMIRNR